MQESLAGIAECAFQKCQSDKVMCEKDSAVLWRDLGENTFLYITELGVIQVKLTKRWRNFIKEIYTTFQFLLICLFGSS